MTAPQPAVGGLLRPGEVAAEYHVDPATARRWADTGKLTEIRTPGGHRRYRRAEIEALLGRKVAR